MRNFLASVQGDDSDPGLATQRDSFPTAKAGPSAQSTPLLRDAQKPWCGHPQCGRPADYLPWGTVGQWPPVTVQWWNAKGRRPKNRPSDEGTTRTPGWHPEENEAQLPQKGTLLPAWVLHQGEEHPKTPLREREGTQGPWRPGATGCCRLLRQLLQRYGWTVARVGPFVIFVSLLVKRTVELTACPVCSESAPKNVTKLHILHSVQNSPSLLENKHFRPKRTRSTSCRRRSIRL